MSKRQPTYFPQSSFNEKEKHEATEQTLQKLARDGLIVDTGRRRWSKRTRSYQIVWAKAPGAKFAPLQQQMRFRPMTTFINSSSRCCRTRGRKSTNLGGWPTVGSTRSLCGPSTGSTTCWTACTAGAGNAR
jgi:hypothetical protein